MEKGLSFIPQKEPQKTFYKPASVIGLFPVSIFLLAVSLIAWGGTYFYNKTLNKQLDELSQSVQRAELGVSADVMEELKSMVDKIETGKKLLAEHRTILPVFSLIGEATLQSIRYYSFNYEFSDGGPVILMGGVAKSYSSLALQAKSFDEVAGIDGYEISNINLTSDGDVTFTVSLRLNPSLVLNRVK